jgi:hypothetical protein
MPHVFYSANLAAVHRKIWANPNFQKSMATWERKFYGVEGSEVEGNLESATAELPASVAAKYPDAEYRGEGEIIRTVSMGQPRSGRG